MSAFAVMVSYRNLSGWDASPIKRINPAVKYGAGLTCGDNLEGLHAQLYPGGVLFRFARLPGLVRWNRVGVMSW